MSRTLALCFLVGFQVLGILVTIGTVGKPREPLKNGAAVAVVIVQAFLTYCVIVLWNCR